MADRDDEGTPASLELPKIGLRRRRKDKKQPESAPSELTPADEPTTQLPSVEEPTVRLPAAEEPQPAPKPQPTSEPEPELAPEPVAQEEPPQRSRERRERKPVSLPKVSLPRISGWPVALVTGLLVGLVLVGLTWSSLRACKAVQGTTSCGNTGYPVLALILVVAVLIGGVLLRIGGVPDPVSTSILGVGVTAVLVLLFLINHLDGPAGAIGVLLVAVVSFAGAYGLTTRVIEPARD